MSRAKFALICLLFVPMLTSWLAPTLAQENVTGAFTVTAPTANIRAGASTEYAVVAVAQRGDVFDVVSSTEAGGFVWYELALEDNVRGWIREDLGDFEAAPPTPTPTPQPQSIQPTVPLKIVDAGSLTEIVRIIDENPETNWSVSIEEITSGGRFIVFASTVDIDKDTISQLYLYTFSYADENDIEKTIQVYQANIVDSTETKTAILENNNLIPILYLDRVIDRINAADCIDAEVARGEEELSEKEALKAYLENPLSVVNADWTNLSPEQRREVPWSPEFQEAYEW